MEKSGIEFVLEGLNSFITGTTKAQAAVERMGRAFDLAGIAAAGGGRGGTGLSSALVQIGVLLTSIAPTVGPVIAAIGGLISVFEGLADKVGGVVGGAIKGTINLIKSLGSAVSAVIRPITNFIASIVNAINPFRMLSDLMERIAYISIGILTADVFRFISRSLVDIAKSAFDAAANFQLLTLRLQGLVARDVIQGLSEEQLAVANFGDILRDAAGPAKELFNWVRQIAVTTPFTVETLSNAFQLAKAYNLTTEMAQKLVVATGNFVAGMGLEDAVISRVIENMGQMIQQGKITGTELRDLARGAYVPTTEVLALMAQKIGVTTDEMREMAKSGKASVNDFIDAFIIVANRDFPQAMERMAATFPGLLSNIKDFVQAVLGFSVLGPAMDVLTAKFGKLFIDILGDPRVLQSADKLGGFLKDMVTGLFPNLTSKSIVDKVVEGVEKLIGLIGAISTGNWQAIVSTLGIPQWVIDSIEDVNDAFANLKTFWDQNGDEMIGILERVMDALGLKDFSPTETVESATEGFKKFSQWLIDNGPVIIGSLDKVADSVEHFVNVTLPLLRGTANFSIGADSSGLDKLAATLNKIFDAGKSIGSAFMSSIKPALETLADSLERLGVVVLSGDGDAVVDFMINLAAAAGGLIASGIGALANFLAAIADALALVGRGLGRVQEGFQEILDANFLEGFQAIFTGIIEGIGGVILYLSSPLAAIFGFVTTAISYFQHLSDELVGHSIIPDMMNMIVASIGGGLATVLSLVLGFTTGIAAAILTWVPAVDNALRVLVLTFQQKGQAMGMQAAAALASTLPAFLSAIRSWMESAKKAIGGGIVIPVSWGNPGAFSAPFTGNPNPGSGGFRPNNTVRPQQTANGGDYRAGQPGIVGEKGWEFFIPKVAGTILSHANSESLVNSLSRFSQMGASMMQPMTAIPSSVSNTTNYNVNVDANYAQTQSPVGISQDLEAVLAKVRL